MAAVTICSDFGAQENKICHCFHFFPSICHEVMGLDAMILVFLNGARGRGTGGGEMAMENGGYEPLPLPSQRSAMVGRMWSSDPC